MLDFILLRYTHAVQRFLKSCKHLFNRLYTAKHLSRVMDGLVLQFQ